MSDWVNVLIGISWALVMFGSWTLTLRHRISVWRERHDARARRSLLTGFASWFTATLFALALLASVFVDTGAFVVTLRGLLFTMGLGAFTGSGILSWSESRRKHDA